VKDRGQRCSCLDDLPISRLRSSGS
jgi:hypothetical protein